MAARGRLSANQSDEEQDIDIESDEDDASSSLEGKEGLDPGDKKAHHNALERKRRDHIKESFVGLRDSLPTVKKEKVSRAQILQQATEYIQYMTKKNGNIQKDIDLMRRQNEELKTKVHQAEKSKSLGLNNSFNSSLPPPHVKEEEIIEICDGFDSDVAARHTKRLKISTKQE